MKLYSIELREKIVSAIENGESSFRKKAPRVSLSKSCVQKLVAQKSVLKVMLSLTSRGRQ